MTKSNTEKKENSFQNPFSENFIPHWEKWKVYKKDQHRFTYKPSGEEAALERLFRLSNGDESVAAEILIEAAGCGWKGFFELKQQFNGNTTRRITEKPQPTGNVAPGGFGQL